MESLDSFGTTDMFGEQPTCKCGKIMTRENSTIVPEVFLCDDCANNEPEDPPKEMV